MKRNKEKLFTDFNDPKLIHELARLAQFGSDRNQKRLARWFEMISFKVREDFALKYATKTWNVAPTGNPTSVIVTYPHVDGKVDVYDIDGGEFHEVHLRELTQKKVSGRATEEMYGCHDIMMHFARPESEDIQDLVDWESLDWFDKGNSEALNERVIPFVRLPKHIRNIVNAKRVKLVKA